MGAIVLKPGEPLRAATKPSMIVIGAFAVAAVWGFGDSPPAVTENRTKGP